MADKSVQDIYLKARQCIDVDSKSDPVREPFKSLYQAKDHLNNCLNNLKNKPDKTELAALATSQILYEMGSIEADTEEGGAGLKYLKEALEVLESIDKDVSPKRSILHLSILNQQAIIDSSRNHMEDALSKLKEAESYYNSLRSKYENSEALDLEENHISFLVGGKDKIPKLMKYSIWIEEEGTKTKYYLAQCYQHLDDKERAAMYCHITLKKQLQNRAFLSFFDPIDWAVNAATLSQFFIVRGDFGLSLHLLACAEYMMTTVTPKPDEGDRFSRREADIARCWIKYCVVLLEDSKDIKSKKDDGLPVEESSSSLPPVRLINEDAVAVSENQVRYLIAKTFDEARQVFLLGQKYITEATKYYTLEDRASDYIAISQDCSKLYRDLLVFECQVDRKCKMHKRRVDLLEDILKVLNPKYYGGECQQINFELAETYTEMMELKYSVLPKGMLKPTDSHVKKINMLTAKAICHYETFLGLIKDMVVAGSGGGDKISKYNDDYVRPALVARFSIGRLQSKSIVGHPKEQLENLERSREHYNYVESYVKKFPDHEQFIKTEMVLMKELIELIPQTIQSLLSSTMF